MKTSRELLIAIDGPSGAGKGTIARTVARTLAYRHIDTGAMYRAVAWKAQRDRVDLYDGEALAALAAASAITVDGRVDIDGHDITSAIRTQAMDEAAALVARQPAVRAVLVGLQRDFGRDGGVVMEGRDIGSVVFPEADVKVYLDASPEERARRRSQDPAHAASREAGSVRHVAQALEARDQSDRTRTASPLKRADDAEYIDTTGVQIEEVVARIMRIIAMKRSAMKRDEIKREEIENGATSAGDAVREDATQESTSQSPPRITRSVR